MTSSSEQNFYPLRTLLRIQTTESQRGKFWSIWWMRKKSLVQFSNCSHCMSSDMMTCIILLETDRMLCFYTHFKVLFWVILTVIVSSSVRKSMCMAYIPKEWSHHFSYWKSCFPLFWFWRWRMLLLHWCSSGFWHNKMVYPGFISSDNRLLKKCSTHCANSGWATCIRVCLCTSVNICRV